MLRPTNRQYVNWDHVSARFESKIVIIVSLWVLKKMVILSTCNIKVSNGVDPDQDRHFVSPNLGPNCLQRLSADG